MKPHSLLKLLALTFASSVIFIGCGDGTLLSKSDSTPNNAQVFNLTRVTQRVVRYDCKGEVTSDQQELQSAPREWVSLYPNKAENFYTLKVSNSAVHRIIEMGGYKFWLDAGNGELSMWVNNGINELDYSFNYCHKKAVDAHGNPTGECAHVPIPEESGKMYVNINYTEKVLDGTQEVHPTKEECKKPKGLSL